MKVNALAPLLLIQGLLESSVEGSWVVNILDFKVESPNADYLSYTGSRFALHGLTSALGVVLAPNMRIISVGRGDVLTSDILDIETLRRVQSESPLGFGPSARDVAESVAFLAKSPAITGQTIFVDSGERFRKMQKDPALDKGEVN